MHNRKEPASYCSLLDTGQLKERVELAYDQLRHCQLCGWDCAIDRAHELGPCRTGVDVKVSSTYLHFGEERPLVGTGGSGAIYLTDCDLRCQFCQTARWNIKGQGNLVSPQWMADQMLEYQDRGAVNINFVTPTHVLPQILEAIFLSAMKGLKIPIVWNSGGYDSLDALRLLDGIVDIYLPDMKYSDTQVGLRLSVIHGYPLVNQAAVLEMFRQVGHLDISDNGVARRGLLVRHLVMPGYMDNTLGVLRWIVENLGSDTYLSLMDQYRPAYRAFSNTKIDHEISPVEYQSVHQQAVALGLTRIDPREPDWTKRG